MKISLDKKVLVEVLTNVSGAVASKSTMLEFQSVEITAGEEWVTFRSFNNETEIQNRVPVSILATDAQVDREGKALVNHKYLLNTAKKLPERIVLETKNSELAINSGKTDMALNLVEGELPAFQLEKPSVDVVVNAGDLKHAFQVGYAAAEDQSLLNAKPILGSVNLIISAEGIITAATDTHRLSKVKVEGIETTADAVKLNPDAASFVEAVQLLPNDEEVRILATDSSVVLSTDLIQVAVRQIEGAYPDVNRIIPDKKKAKTTVVVNRKELFGCIERAMIMSPSDDNNTVSLNVQSAENSIIVATKCASVGSMNEKVEATTKGDDLTVAFNAKYVLEALRHMEKDNVTIYLFGSVNPFLLEEEAVDDIHLVLPLRVNNVA